MTKSNGLGPKSVTSPEIEMISKFIVKVSNDVSALSGSINDKGAKLETTLVETKISHKVGQTNIDMLRM